MARTQVAPEADNAAVASSTMAIVGSAAGLSNRAIRRSSMASRSRSRRATAGLWASMPSSTITKTEEVASSARTAGMVLAMPSPKRIFTGRWLAKDAIAVIVLSLASGKVPPLLPVIAPPPSLRNGPTEAP